MAIKFHSKEHQILSVLRQTLSAVIRDTTPPPGRAHPLHETTIEDVKHCFMLITAREKEIVDQAGGNEMDKRPQYADTANKPQVVQFSQPKKKK